MNHQSNALKITSSRLASTSVELNWQFSGETTDGGGQQLTYQLAQRLIAESTSNSSDNQSFDTQSSDQLTTTATATTTIRQQQLPLVPLSIFDIRDYQVIYEGSTTSKRIEGLRADSRYSFRLRVRHGKSTTGDNGWNGATESVIEVKTEDALTMEHRLRDLIAAVAGQDSDSVVEMLQEHHISNMDTQDKQGHTVLMVASRVGLAVEGIRALCEHGASVSATTQSGKTALMMAARVGNVQAIKVLSKFGADINEMDFAGTTALMLACDYGQVEAARVLLELGADAQKVDTSGSNCLLRVCALPNPHKDIITLLVRQAKIDVNSRNPKGCTPLMFAAMQGRVETVECLMNLGADKSLKNANDNTAYMLAESLNNSRVTRWFEEHK